MNDDTSLLREFAQTGAESAFAVVGSALGVSENAARMRVDRALERLRHELARRGVVSTAAALASVLGAHAVTPAPTALAAAVSAAAWTVPAACLLAEGAVSPAFCQTAATPG
jgi:hypothetical protein